MADILTQLQTCLDQLATQFYATLGYLTTYHDNSPATVPPPSATAPTAPAAPALAKIPKNSSAPPVPASAPLAAQQQSNQTQQQTPAEIPQPAQPGAAGAAPEDTTTGTGTAQDPALPPAPDSPRTFAARQRELARDLVLKEQQIEYLISVLPGIGSSEAEQERRIRELEGELRRWEGVRGERMLQLKALRGRLEGVLGAMEVGVYGERDF